MVAPPQVIRFLGFILEGVRQRSGDAGLACWRGPIALVGSSLVQSISSE